MQDESQKTTGLSLLSALVDRPKVNNLWFNDQIVTLDGYTFNHCRFDSCKLYLSSTNFEIHHCFIDENTVVYFNGEILKILKLFNSRSDWYYKNYPNFTPVRHDDGTISINFSAV